MMRFGRVSAVLAMLVLQPLAAAKAGNCPHARQNSNNVSASSYGIINADFAPLFLSDSDFDSGPEDAFVCITLARTGMFGSSAILDNAGTATLTAPNHAYIPQGDTDTVMQASVTAVNDPSAGAEVGNPTTLAGNGGSHSFLIEDDGDSVQENVSVLGTVNIDLTLDQSLGTGNCTATINGPGVSGTVSIGRASNGTLTATGTISYTDRNGQPQTIDADDALSGDSIHISIQTLAAKSEGDTFSVGCSSGSSCEMVANPGESGVANITTSVNWAFESVAP